MSGKKRHVVRVFFIMLLNLMFCSAPGWGGDKLFLSGVEGGNGVDSLNYYTFAAVIVPFSNGNLGNGFVQKYWVDFVGYDYTADIDTIKATAPGVEGSIGYQKSGPKWWSSAYIGIRYSDTHLSPDNPESRVRGGQTRAKLQVEGERMLSSRWKTNAIISYIIRSDSYYTRLRGLYRLSGELYAGAEAIVLGDPDYRIWQWGLVVFGFEPFPEWNAGVKAGIKKIENAQTGGYFGLELIRLF